VHEVAEADAVKTAGATASTTPELDVGCG
jgi:hypothetical protein